MSWLFVLGFALIFIGMVVVTAGSFSSPGASVGIVVFVGPIPIVFGKGSNGTTLVLIALVAAIGTVIAFCLPFLVQRRTRQENKAY